MDKEGSGYKVHLFNCSVLYNIDCDVIRAGCCVHKQLLLNPPRANGGCAEGGSSVFHLLIHPFISHGGSFIQTILSNGPRLTRGTVNMCCLPVSCVLISSLACAIGDTRGDSPVQR